MEKCNALEWAVQCNRGQFVLFAGFGCNTLEMEMDFDLGIGFSHNFEINCVCRRHFGRDFKGNYRKG